MFKHKEWIVSNPIIVEFGGDKENGSLKETQSSKIVSGTERTPGEV